MVLDTVSSKGVVLLLVIHICGGSGFGPSLVLHFLVSGLVLHSSGRGRESWMLYLICLPDVCDC